MNELPMSAQLDIESGAQIFKALGHPARLKMVAALASGEQCVCDLTELVGLDTSTVSKHLTVLKGAGVVSAKRKGTWMHYRLELECVSWFLECVSKHLQD